MWVYALKSDHQGYVIRFKARIVALGNHQRPGIDFLETFSPVARMSSFRVLLALAATLNLHVYGGDINTAYLNASLGIRQYLRSIEGFPCRVDGNMYMVLKALYGLRQSGREWNSELNEWLLSRGFQRSLTEPCLYYWVDGDTVVYVLVYVDDILVATNDEAFKSKLFSELDNTYGIKDQDLLTEYLGVEVEQTTGRITIRQSKYTREILEKFGYKDAHAVGNPMEVNARLTPLHDDEVCDTSFAYREGIGMLMYLATCTRPDLAFALGQLSRFVAKPSTKHIGTLKRALRYLAGTQEYGITYVRQQPVDRTVVLEGFCDSDWANDPETRRSTTGFVFTLAGGAVSWMSRRQSIVALSTAEAEYVAACEATMEAAAESNILQEILPQRMVQLRIGIDNQAAHVMATNPTYSRRTRHIELRWHFVREQVEKGAIELHKVKGEINPADTFTKPLDKKRLKALLESIGVGEA
uniref:Reverse transcriptase Ty1/copia-type domain-containing protein n=1 Tax=Phytophthora ramorum TaxID=164328 RepID=H3G8H7_PHYRM